MNAIRGQTYASAIVGKEHHRLGRRHGKLHTGTQSMFRVSIFSPSSRRAQRDADAQHGARRGAQNCTAAHPNLLPVSTQ